MSLKNTSYPIVHSSAIRKGQHPVLCLPQLILASPPPLPLLARPPRTLDRHDPLSTLPRGRTPQNEHITPVLGCELEGGGQGRVRGDDEFREG